MLAVTFADLLYRARQFAIAVVGVALVLGMALLLAGLAAGFTVELQNTIGAVGADRWIMPHTADGRISAFAAFPQSELAAIARAGGVSEAEGLLVVPDEVATVDGHKKTIVLMGVAPHRLGAPAVSTGRALGSGVEAVADERLDAPVGSHVIVGSADLPVVGTTTGNTLQGGLPVVYVPLRVAQRLAVGGRLLITAAVTRGVPQSALPGFDVLTPDQVVTASVAALGPAVSSINNTRFLMWIIAAAIVAAMVYVAALERTRDFAVLKALGSSSASLFGSLAIQAVVVTLLASAVGEVLSQVMTPVLLQPVDIPTLAYLTLPVIAAVIGLIASTAALRRALHADPATAFG